MTLRFAGKAAFPALFLLASLAAAQTITTPPVKMGLWQSESTTTVAGMENMPMGGAMAPHKIVSQSCFTPDTWQKDLQGARREQQKMNCTISGFHQDSHRISLDEQCSPHQDMTTTLHIEMLIDSDTAMHGTVDMKMSAPGLPHGMQMKSEIASHFVSSDCGDVKPGHARVLQH